MKPQKPTATVLRTGTYFGRMAYADVAESPTRVVRYYSCGSAERVYFYNEGYVAQEVSK